MDFKNPVISFGRYKKRVFIFGFITLPLFWVIVMSSFLQLINISYIGFALDNAGLLYLGKSGKIDVYENSELIDTVYRNTWGYNMFTIQDEKLYVHEGGLISIYDLSGNKIESTEDYDTIREFERNLRSQQNILIRGTFTRNNEEYTEKNTLFFYRILKVTDDGYEVIYKMPTIDYVCKLLLIIIVVSAFIFLPITLFQIIKDHEHDKKNRTKSL